jgi:hypothetical protein
MSFVLNKQQRENHKAVIDTVSANIPALKAIVDVLGDTLESGDYVEAHSILTNMVSGITHLHDAVHYLQEVQQRNVINQN